MTERARAAIGSEAIETVAERGYYNGEEILGLRGSLHRSLSAEADHLGRQC
jgi:hypothetical protein